ncbi:MAG: endonuclease VIII [Gammaproteobacteria bacterium]
MPEGPEIRRIADKLEKTVCKKPVRGIWFARPDLKKYQKDLAASAVESVKTKGKALLTEFDCGLTVYSHNQLYGRWFFKPKGERPNTSRSLRWKIDTDKHSALLYSASDIAVLPSDELDAHPFLAKAGIDILSDKPDIKTLSEYLAQPRFARRALGGLLLDQHFVAGIGNYLRSEILYTAGFHPTQKIGDLDGHGRRRLARQIILITERAYQTGGITNDAALVKRLKKSGWTRGRFRHWVFSREDEPCHRCADSIIKTVIASRRLYYCPGCQGK